MRILISLIMALIVASPTFSAQEWDKSIPCKTGVGSCGSADQRADFPADQQANNAALDRVLANYRQGMTLSYSSATTVSVSAGEVVCSNSDGSVRKMRQNTSATNVTFTDIDTGAEEASKTYYIYANCDADATTATFKVSLSTTTPTGVTYYKRIGSFYNDASSNITLVSNDAKDYQIGSVTSKSDNTAYQALTDGVFIGVIESGSTLSSCYVKAFSDSASSPTTLVGGANVFVDVPFESNTTYQVDSFSVHVKGGNYYKGVKTCVSGSGFADGTATYYFIPTGN